MPDPASLPIEVSLVEKVKTCRTCKWFWSGTPPYGPYPGFDWKTDFPPEARHDEKQPLPETKTPAKAWLSGNLTGDTIPDPGIMHGCRKAPIMTIGINPNLTAWFPYSSSAPWIYPAFKDDARYAYYYRHFTLYQESVSPDFVRANLSPDHRQIAEDDGYVTMTARENSHNYLTLAVRYRGRTEDTVYEIVWKPEERWVVVQNGGFPDKPESWFKKGDTLAGRFDAPTGVSAEVFENAAGYYQRMVPVLERFKKLTGLEGANLTVGEDVAQHDMVGCASPGWQTKFDMPMDKIASNCVSDHGWVVSQFVQSQPAVAILVSASALAMFRSVFAPYMTLEDPDRDVMQLLEETCLRPTYVTIDIGPVKFRTRLLVSPHFSYPDGFFPGSRLSDNAWKAFAADYPSDAQKLEEAKRIKPDPKTDPGPYLVDLKPADELRARLSISGQQVLHGYFVDPFQMMAQALADEFKSGAITFDPQSKRLARAKGPCRFCVNEKWSFPEGCAYGKPNEPAVPPGQLEDAVAQILATAKAYSKNTNPQS